MDISLEQLNLGEVPQSTEILQQVTAGVRDLTDFLRKHYLQEYIPQGGSKIKFLTGRAGSGKTHTARIIKADAESEGYVTVYFSAKIVLLYDFREIYLEILRQCDLEKILQGCAEQIIREMNYDPSRIPEGKNFMDYLSDRHEADALTKNTIRVMLREKFTKNPLLDNGFANCCSLLTGSFLGHPYLEQANRDLLYAFLHGDRTIKISQIRALGLSASKISKYNARHLLRSLAEIVRMSGNKGLLVIIDDMETLLNRGSVEMVKYTKLRREDTYESIRQLIDDIDSMHNIMFVFGFDRTLIDDEKKGIKSYPALWMRVQNEIHSERFNRFADIVDLDSLALQEYTLDYILEMSLELAEKAEKASQKASILDEEKLQSLIEKAKYGAIGLPQLVKEAILEGETYE